MGTWSYDRPSLEGMVQNFKGGDKHDVISWSLDFAKLNPMRFLIRNCLKYVYTEMPI